MKPRFRIYFFSSIIARKKCVLYIPIIGGFEQVDLKWYYSINNKCVKI